MARTSHADVDRFFTYHAPTAHQVDDLQTIRSFAQQFGHMLLDLTPAGADQSAAIRKLREVVMTANAAIVCQRPKADPEAAAIPDPTETATLRPVGDLGFEWTCRRCGTLNHGVAGFDTRAVPRVVQCAHCPGWYLSQTKQRGRNAYLAPPDEPDAR